MSPVQKLRRAKKAENRSIEFEVGEKKEWREKKEGEIIVCICAVRGV
jgi:hypothetical protein